MQNRRDSSIWRSLAVALGDGLAFAVGMTLTQAAGRQLSMPQHSGIKRLEPPAPVEPAATESSIAIDHKALEAIVHAVEARLAAHSEQVDNRLAGLDVRMAIELHSLDQQDHSIGRRISHDIGVLRQEMAGLHREFAEAVGRVVAEQVSSQVRSRAAALEQSVAGRVALSVEAAVGPLEQKLRSGLEQKDREISELRRRLADIDTNVLELVLGIGRICRQGAEKLAPPASVPENEGTPESESAGQLADVPPDAPDQKPNRLWRVPLVS
jgi:hypothetical protein